LFLQRQLLEELGTPIFERFAERLEPGDEELILDAAARRFETMMTVEAAQEILYCEVFERLLPRRAAALGVSAEEAREDLLRFRAQLDGLRDGSPTKRVYYTVSALQRCATRAQERAVIACSCLPLAMGRNRVDVYKRRAIEKSSANTRFAQLDRERVRAFLGDLHLFVLVLEPELRAAACRLLDAYCVPGGSASGLRAERAHGARRQLRKVYDDRRRDAKELWMELAKALDAAGLRPIDLEAEFAARLRERGLSARDVAARIDKRWGDLRISGVVPRHLLPETQWERILGKADRPPTWVLEGGWKQILEGRGQPVAEALERLVKAAKRADAAKRDWNLAAETSLKATQERPAALKDAIESFNRSLDEALSITSTKGRVIQ